MQPVRGAGRPGQGGELTPLKFGAGVRNFILTLIISAISRGRGLNQRIVLHDKNLLFDLDPPV